MVRLCLDCGDPFYGTGSRCGDCQHSKDRARNHARGERYGPAHQAERRAWQQIIDIGEVECWRCNGERGPLDPGAWDLGHRDGLPSLPEHPTCNRSAGGRAAHDTD
jgi:hypothetical protein